MQQLKKYPWVLALSGLCFSSHVAMATSKQQPLQSVQHQQPVHKAEAEKRRLVIKVAAGDRQLLNHKGLLGGFQQALEKKYDVVYTTDLDEYADIFLLTGYSRTFVQWRNVLKDTYRWLFGLDKAMVTPERICADSSPIKILYSHETWTSFPEGFDDCFDLMISYDQRVGHPRYMTVAGTAYEFFYDKISTDYNPKKDVWRADGCQPSKRKYDVCFLNSNGGGKDFMDLAFDRVELFNAFSKRTYVASGGKVENNIGYTVPRGEELDWMRNCKFVISYENRVYPGYITEKPYQAWLAGAIPIYAAHRSVLGNIDREAVVFGPDFESHEAIVDHVMNLVQDERAYCQIWEKNLHVDPDKNYAVLQAQIRDRLMEIVDEKIEA